jgi:hypothetical protein
MAVRRTTTTDAEVPHDGRSVGIGECEILIRELLEYPSGFANSNSSKPPIVKPVKTSRKARNCIAR